MSHRWNNHSSIYSTQSHFGHLQDPSSAHFGATRLQSGQLLSWLIPSTLLSAAAKRLSAVFSFNSAETMHFWAILLAANMLLGPHAKCTLRMQPDAKRVWDYCAAFSFAHICAFVFCHFSFERVMWDLRWVIATRVIAIHVIPHAVCVYTFCFRFFLFWFHRSQLAYM